MKAVRMAMLVGALVAWDDAAQAQAANDPFQSAPAPSARPRPAPAPRPARPPAAAPQQRNAPIIVDFQQFIRVQQASWWIGRILNIQVPQLDHNTRDISPALNAVNIFSRHTGQNRIDIRSDEIQNIIYPHYVAANRAAISRIGQARGPLARYSGVYRRNCYDLGWGGRSALPRESNRPLEEVSQWIVVFQERNALFATIGQLTFKEMTILRYNQVPFNDGGVSGSAMRVEVSDVSGRAIYVLRDDVMAIFGDENLRELINLWNKCPT